MSRASLLFLALAACSSGKKPPPDAQPKVYYTVDARTERASVDAAPAPVPVPRRAAMRCRLHGEPLARACDGPRGSIAVDAGGRLHVVVAGTIRRYRRIEGDGCELELDGTLAVPVVEPEGQVLGKGPVYMQSGGPQWKLTATGGRLYVHDYLRGIHRVEGDAIEPVCPRLQGVGSIAVAGKQAYLARNDGERVTLGGRCKTRSAGFDPSPRFGLYAIDGALVADTGDHAVRYDAELHAAATLGAGDSFAPGGLCAVTAVVPCAGDICVADGNCKKVVRYAADGTLVGELDSSALFEHFPQALYDAAAAPDGIYLLTGDQDGSLCEDAVHFVPTPPG